MIYTEFLENKIVIAESYGVDIDKNRINPIALPHQKDIIHWSIAGGRRAIFASFGLGKTLMQLEIARLIIEITGKPFLICMPLGVVGEFRDDNDLLKTGFDIKYITDTDEVDILQNAIYVTNYERVRKGDIKPEYFGGVSFDEASILRNLKTETTNYVLKHFGTINYRFVATATPTPNDFIEILNYADFLGVIDRGHALTRFFQRDSTKAGHLTLYENKKEEFWKWVSSWAVFINKPSDLGYDDTGYNLPKLNFHEVEIDNSPEGVITNKDGKIVMFKDLTKSLPDTSKEKNESIDIRVEKAYQIVKENAPYSNWILWHHIDKERDAIEKRFKSDEHIDLRTVTGSQKNSEKEKLLIDFKHSMYQILSTKPKIAGSGCNFQKDCNNMIYVGIDYKFNDFIQGIHRLYRFKQEKEVNVWVIFTNNEREVLKTLKDKWRKHIELQTEMINLVREYGLNTDKITADMKRQIFKNKRSATIGNATVFNDDTVHVHENMADDSTDMILTSIPFGDHYEYSDNYNDFGHNNGNEEFFKQMDYLTPHLLRTLKPGKIAAIHVKDRIRYSYQNGTSFTTIDDFSGKTVSHFVKHGFYLVGKITVTTDVVRENNQTYRLGWSEQCKDATKMGVGLPEYILLFRKRPTEMNNAYADEPVIKAKNEHEVYCNTCQKIVDLKDKKEIKVIDDVVCCVKCETDHFSPIEEIYPVDNWQLDAHAYWKSSGDRFMSSQELSTAEMKTIFNRWREFDKSNVYNFQEHLKVCSDLDKAGKLSRLFMTIPPTSSNEMVWTDVNRMHTLNANQANRKKEKHICPLQLDIIERLINRFTMKGDVVDDPFGGLFSTAYKALEMGRKAISAELNPSYYDDGLFYLKGIEYKINVPTLFEL
ncbi:DNA methyltransferase [Flavobacterium hungaricum]|uniref:DNA methylase N-4 n=1 Tax=Flavobacterium hungaricum TaxID=2082725 RepID=A0ABR9TRK5_9FLAO|nr:DNA methyltransferase [Flavobacterium hungaricum]MBE8727958.1 DNA methylase N-4 [Flavobacterium hungaricum]